MSKRAGARGSGNIRRTTIEATKKNYGVFAATYSLSNTVLGSGAFGVVKKCTEKSTGKEYAVKILDKNMVNADKAEREAVENEITIMKRLGQHELLLTMRGNYEDENNLYIVSDLLTGGELMARISEQDHFSEKDAATYIKQILTAVKYMHDNDIIHRDLKPQNILLESSAPDATIRICDFGLSVFRPKDMLTDASITGTTGTPHYMAPELLDQKAYDVTVDVWSIGVISYIMMSGRYPFDGQNLDELFANIQKGEFDVDSGTWSQVSNNAKNFLRRLLRVTPSERYSIQEALDHPWLSGGECSDENLTIMEMMRGFLAEQRLKKGMLTAWAVQAFTRGLHKGVKKEGSAVELATEKLKSLTASGGKSGTG